MDVIHLLAFERSSVGVLHDWGGNACVMCNMYLNDI